MSGDRVRTFQITPNYSPATTGRHTLRIRAFNPCTERREGKAKKVKLKRIAAGVLLGAMSVTLWGLPAAADPLGDGTRVTVVDPIGDGTRVTGVTPYENNW
jgi:hypothetical protein